MVLEDNQVTLQTMMGSRFIMGVKDEVRSGVEAHTTSSRLLPSLAGPRFPLMRGDGCQRDRGIEHMT